MIKERSPFVLRLYEKAEKAKDRSEAVALLALARTIQRKEEHVNASVK